MGHRFGTPSHEPRPPFFEGGWETVGDLGSRLILCVLVELDFARNPVSVVQWHPFSSFFGGCPTTNGLPKLGSLCLPGSLNN